MVTDERNEGSPGRAFRVRRPPWCLYVVASMTTRTRPRVLIEDLRTMHMKVNTPPQKRMDSQGVYESKGPIQQLTVYLMNLLVANKFLLW